LPTITCRDCRRPFELSEGERQWFIDRSMRQPARCAFCRKLARQQREHEARLTKDDGGDQQ
jgi:hypothetical protein